MISPDKLEYANSHYCYRDQNQREVAGAFLARPCAAACQRAVTGRSRGVLSNGHPYRDPRPSADMIPSACSDRIAAKFGRSWRGDKNGNRRVRELQ